MASYPTYPLWLGSLRKLSVNPRSGNQYLTWGVLDQTPNQSWVKTGVYLWEDRGSQVRINNGYVHKRYRYIFLVLFLPVFGLSQKLTNSRRETYKLAEEPFGFFLSLSICFWRHWVFFATRAFLCCSEQMLLFVAVHWLFIAGAAFVRALALGVRASVVVARGL